jgi:hypothetical protein
MIRLRTAIRVMPAFWLALPLTVFAAWYVTLLAPSDRYAVDATAKASMTIAFVGSVCAACAAWEGSRLRRARLWKAPSVRSRAAVAAWSLLPVVAVGLLAVVVAMVIQVVRSSAGLPDPRFIAMTALDLVAYAAAGFAIGILLPFAVAGPLAIVGTFIWIGFVPAMEPVWLRHLTGMFRDCCGLSQDLSPRAVLASTIIDLGIVASAALLVAGPADRLRRFGASLSSFGVTVLVGALLVAGMTYAPVVARDTAHVECRTDSDVTVCTWPEHQTRASEVARIVAGVRIAWQQAGIEAPSVFTEADPSMVPPSALSFGFDGVLSKEDDIINSLAFGMLPPFPDCPFGGTGGAAFDYLQAWYDAAGGMSPAALTRNWAGLWDEPDYPAVLTVVAQLQAAPPESRRAWVLRAETASQDCDVWRSDLIAVTP